MKLLNLGSGYVDHQDWVNVDKLNYGTNLVMDVVEGLDFPDGYFDFVLMNHTLQMFHYDELPVVLKEVRRVMKPGATLRVLTPDLEYAIHEYTYRFGGGKLYFPIADELEGTVSGKFARYIFWHGDTRCAFDNESLSDLLYRNGFKDVNRTKFGECELDSREEESLIMEAKK